MKVAYVAFAPFISGAERALQVMLLHAQQAGITPIVVCPPGAQLPPWCAERGIPTFILPLADRDRWHPIRWFGSVARLAALLRRERVDVVHSNQIWSFAAAGAAARLLGLASVCHLRDEVSPAATRWWCASGVGAVVSVSRHIENLTRPAWPGEQGRPIFRRLFDPIEPRLDTAGEAAVARRQMRQRFGIAPETVLFGFIGQIVGRKGVLPLLEATAALAADPRWHLIIAGRDPEAGQPYERDCRNRVAALGLASRVTFTGFLDDVGPFYDAIDLAVVPSVHEPLGLIPFEAGAHGKAAIAFASGGLVEAIDDGVTGWLVPTGDVAGLTARMAAVLADPASAAVAGARNREFVTRECGPDGYMRQMAALYTDLLQAKGRVQPVGTRAAYDHKD